MKKIIICFLIGTIILCFGACSKTNTKTAENKNIESTSSQSVNGNESKSNITSNSTTKTTLKAKSTTLKQTEITKGTSTKNSYINKSLGIKISAPKGWSVSSAKELQQSDDGSQTASGQSADCMIYKMTEISTGYDYKSVSVYIQKGAKNSTLKEWEQNLKKSCDDSNGYMKCINKGYITIGGRQYLQLAIEYPDSPDISVFYMATIQGKTIAILNFTPFNSDDAENFIKTNIIEL